MEYRHLGRTGLEVSELCLGTMQFGCRLQSAELTRLNELTKYPRNWRPIWD